MAHSPLKIEYPVTILVVYMLFSCLLVVYCNSFFFSNVRIMCYSQTIVTFVLTSESLLYVQDKLHEEIVLKDVKVAENSTKNENHSFSVSEEI